MKDRNVLYLEEISHLRVETFRDTNKRGQTVWTFYNGNRAVHATYSYKKARSFALGVSYGRNTQ